MDIVKQYVTNQLKVAGFPFDEVTIGGARTASPTISWLGVIPEPGLFAEFLLGEPERRFAMSAISKGAMFVIRKAEFTAHGQTNMLVCPEYSRLNRLERLAIEKLGDLIDTEIEGVAKMLSGHIRVLSQASNITSEEIWGTAYNTFRIRVYEVPYTSINSDVKVSDLPMMLAKIEQGVYRPIALRCDVIYADLSVVSVEQSFMQDVRQPDYGGMRLKVISEALAKARQRITQTAISSVAEVCHA